MRSIDEVGKKKPKLQVAQAQEIVADAYLAEQLIGCITLDSLTPAGVQAALDLIDAINGLGLAGPPEDELTSKAKDAGKRLAEGKAAEACKKLDELDRAAARKLSAAQYTTLLPAVQAAQSSIGC